jgi:tripartite-type tricarboxylate transporter receptor subunit TctC
MWRRPLILVLSIALIGGILISTAHGRDYPTKTIEILCPFSAGGSFDLYSRLIAKIYSRYLGQSMVVINKPGGAGTTIIADMLNSKADGYKLGILDTGYFTAAAKAQKMPFDPRQAVVPIGCVWQIKMGLTVKGDAPWKTLNDLLDYAKKNPKLKWGHSGRGLPTYMNTRIIFEKAGVETIDVPYKGAPQSTAAILGGHIDAVSQPHGAIKAQIDSGQLRYLVVYSDKRYGDPSDVPTATELGFPEATKLTPISGIWVRKDTPKEIKKILTEALKKAYKDPDFKKGIENIGDEPRFESAEFMMESIKTQEKITVPILKELGIYKGD